jgi:hypothetical protein
MLDKLREALVEWLTHFPQPEHYLSANSMRYWLRRDKQAKLDFKGVIE